MNPEVPMNDENDRNRLTEDGGSLAGDSLLHAIRRDMQGLYGLVKALDNKVEALDNKVEARLRDTTPMWEVVVSRLDTMVSEQASQGRRLDVIETELRQLRRR